MPIVQFISLKHINIHISIFITYINENKIRSEINKINSISIIIINLNNDHLNYKNHGFCSIEPNLQTWGCNITMLQYNNKVFYFNRYVIFISADDNMFRSLILW